MGYKIAINYNSFSCTNGCIGVRLWFFSTKYFVPDLLLFLTLWSSVHSKYSKCVVAEEFEFCGFIVEHQLRLAQFLHQRNFALSANFSKISKSLDVHLGKGTKISLRVDVDVDYILRVDYSLRVDEFLFLFFRFRSFCFILFFLLVLFSFFVSAICWTKEIW